MAGTFNQQFNNEMKKAIPILQSKIDVALDKAVAPLIKQTEKDSIYEEVYSRPSGVYERRCEDGGLSDMENMKHTVENGVLTVTNKTPPNDPLNGYDYSFKIDDGIEWHRHGASSTPRGSSIARIVEFGIYNPRSYGYDYWKSAKPRPFTAKTIEKLRMSKSYLSAMKVRLKRQGVDVR